MARGERGWLSLAAAVGAIAVAAAVARRWRNDRDVESEPGFEIRRFPSSRRLVVDGGRLAQNRHMIHGLTEVDVTLARALIQAHERRTGKRLSFTAFLVYCLGRAVEQNRSVQAMRDWRGRLVVFDDVDVMVVVEIELQGEKFPLVTPLRSVNRLGVWDLHREIRAIQENPRSSQSVRTPFLASYYRLPEPVRRLGYWLVYRKPHWYRRFAGTVALTAVGMFAGGGGWGIGAPHHTTSLTVGGIEEKPAVVDGQIQVRQFLSLTFSFDHDLVDGAPAARFAAELRHLVESGAGLEEMNSGLSGTES